MVATFKLKVKLVDDAGDFVTDYKPKIDLVFEIPEIKSKGEWKDLQVNVSV